MTTTVSRAEELTAAERDYAAQRLEYDTLPPSHPLYTASKVAPRHAQTLAMLRAWRASAASRPLDPTLRLVDAFLFRQRVPYLVRRQILRNISMRYSGWTADGTYVQLHILFGVRYTAEYYRHINAHGDGYVTLQYLRDRIRRIKPSRGRPEEHVAFDGTGPRPPLIIAGLAIQPLDEVWHEDPEKAEKRKKRRLDAEDAAAVAKRYLEEILPAREAAEAAEEAAPFSLERPPGHFP